MALGPWLPGLMSWCRYDLTARGLLGDAVLLQVSVHQRNHPSTGTFAYKPFINNSLNDTYKFGRPARLLVDSPYFRLYCSPCRVGSTCITCSAMEGESAS